MKIGFITMHKVKNCGSNLQAYALQYTLEKMGHRAEIIDYQYAPPSSNASFRTKVLSFALDALRGFPKKRQQIRFKHFQDSYYHLTPVSYTKESILKVPPIYDVYMSGSDQVWNPRYIANDTNFMLSFVGNDKVKVSYASSFACTEIPEEHRERYAEALSQFKSITVREQAGVNIVKDLTGKESQLACDPVLLLNEEEWTKIAGDERPMNKSYILVYTLGYMFNPRPNIYEIIDHVQKELGYEVVYLNGIKSDAFRKKSRVVKDFGPIEFLRWIKNAEFVITDSFHCTAFSVIFNRPLMGIVKSLDTKDGRLTTLLKKVGSEKSIVPYTSNVSLVKSNIASFKPDLNMLGTFRDESLLTLRLLLTHNVDLSC